MAGKKVIIAVLQNFSLDGEDEEIRKFRKKAVVVQNYQGGDVLSDITRIDGAMAADLDTLAAALEGGSPPLVYLNLTGAGNNELGPVLAKILEVSDRSTLTVLADSRQLVFYGFGIDPKRGVIDRPVQAKDIVPTLSYIADLPLPEDCTGAVIYQVLKDVNMKAREILKLKEAIQRMEAALQRDNREPWDKHDCA